MENHAGPQVQIVGSQGDQPGYFSRPRAVGALSDGSFVVIDRTGRIQRFDRDGNYLLHWWLPAYDNGTPTGFSVDPRDDSLWIADTHYQRILHYSNAGTLLGQFGESGTEPGQMIFPTDVALDPDDYSLWVSEYGNKNRIMHFTADGEFLGEWGKIVETEADLLRPQSLRVMPQGDLFVCDAGHHRIWRFHRGKAPEPIGSWGTAGTAPGQLKYPYSLDIAPDSTLYIIEYGNSRVSHFTATGEFLGTWGGPGHGPDELYSPWGLGVDGFNHRLLVADTNNNRVLIVTPLP
jgi:DNA-binding beta-propeller fold protein YncE